jgi:hypothetical protein
MYLKNNNRLAAENYDNDILFRDLVSFEIKRLVNRNIA